MRGLPTARPIDSTGHPAIPDGLDPQAVPPAGLPAGNGLDPPVADSTLGSLNPLTAIVVGPGPPDDAPLVLLDPASSVLTVTSPVTLLTIASAILIALPFVLRTPPLDPAVTTVIVKTTLCKSTPPPC